MSDIKMPADAGAGNRAGVYLAILQLVFTLGWTTYVIYLPKLCAQVGIAPSAVILILMLDQAIFTITDTAMGIAADKIAPFVGRLGVFVGITTAISCAAFIALPYVAGTGPGAQVWFIVLIVIWVVTASALRAPPLTLLGKYGARPALPFLSALAMLGYGVAGAVSPYLGVLMRNHDAADSLRDFGRGAADYRAGAVESRARSGAATRRRDQAGRTGKAARPDADVLHRLDGAAVVGLSVAFQHQQRAVLPAFCQTGRSAMADAGVLDRVQYRDVPGQRDRKASRRVDRDGRRRPVGRAGGCWRRVRRQPQHADSGTIRRGRGVGLHADERGRCRLGDRGQRRGRQGGRAGIFRAGARNLRADGGGRRRPAEAAGICAAAALGPGGMLGGRRRRPAGDRGAADAADDAARSLPSPGAWRGVGFNPGCDDPSP